MMNSLFADLPSHLPDKLITILIDAADVRIERIVSHGHVSPKDFLYDQPMGNLVPAGKESASQLAATAVDHGDKPIRVRGSGVAALDQSTVGQVVIVIELCPNRSEDEFLLSLVRRLP